MNILFIILTYQRPKITSFSINSLIENTKINPSEIAIFDDGSDVELQKRLLEFSDLNRGNVPITVTLRNANGGVGLAFEEAYELIRRRSPDIAVIVESDYVWRKDWLSDVLNVFEAAPYTICIPGTSHPDMYDKVKTHTEFPKLMIDQFGEDVAARDYMYEPFDLKTKGGIIKVQGVSNSCGCQIIHWARTKRFLFEELGVEEQYWEWIARACHKWGGEPWGRARASDAHMSGTPTYYWEQWAIKNNIDISENFAWLDICDYSISSHRCIGGINGKVFGFKEGDTFLHSKGWDDKYLITNPRQQ